MRIKDLAAASSTPVETIRYYEREGLLPAAPRSANNYRLYTALHAERLGFIRQCRNLDMALAEIRALLKLRDAPPENCAQVSHILDQHLGHVVQRMHELRTLQLALKALRARCSTPQTMADCGILNELGKTAARGLNAKKSAGSQRHIRGAH